MNPVVSTIRIRRDIAEVFDFLTTPKNWPEWHPASISVAGSTDHSLTIGEEVTEEFIAAGRRGRTVWRVTAREAPIPLADRKFGIGSIGNDHLSPAYGSGNDGLRAGHAIPLWPTHDLAKSDVPPPSHGTGVAEALFRPRQIWRNLKSNSPPIRSLDR